MPSTSIWPLSSYGIGSFAQRFLSTARDVHHSGSMYAPSGSDWTSFHARFARYSYFWGFYESTVYDHIHTWAQQNKADLGLYKDLEPVYNPVYRLCEFWATHIWGGTLDPSAGDGRIVPTALPIETGADGSDSLRSAIARLWRDSCWQENKTLCCRLGSVMGDVGIKVDDDVEKGRVTLSVIDPNEIVFYDSDDRGQCRGYVLEQYAEDPDRPGWYASRREHAWREGDDVVYLTEKNGEPFAWNGVAASWRVRYGFVPFVLIGHIRMKPRVAFGMPEPFAGRRKFHALDHAASMLVDFIGRSSDSPWLLAGVQDPNSAVTTRSRDRTEETAKPAREEIPALYAGAGAKAQSLVSDMNVDHALKVVDTLMGETKSDYPELRRDIEEASGDASGKALRMRLRRIESKAIDRRAGYDNALVRAHQMAIAIAGWRGYEGYEGFGLNSYERGDLNHWIGNRSVFQVDPEDRLDLRKKFYDMAESADRAGQPITATIRLEGLSAREIGIIEEEREKALAMGLPLGRAKQAQVDDEASAMAVQAPGAT